MMILTFQEMMRRAYSDNEPERVMAWICWSPYAGSCGYRHRDEDEAERHRPRYDYVPVPLGPDECPPAV